MMKPFKIRILGAGWYGCHIGRSLSRAGHVVEIHEIATSIFSGASGSIPARCHQGFHYPRSRMTRAACQEHQSAFLSEYRFLTHSVPVNLYAIAAEDSLVDFDQYVRTLAGEVPFIPVDAAEFGLSNCEGAVLTGERHIVTDLARRFFETELRGLVHFKVGPKDSSAADFDLTIDCTFGSNSEANVDRYEPCLVLLLKGPTDRAITVMDGPFGSLYPWDEEQGLCSLSSARWTPFRKDLKTYAEAREFLEKLLRREADVQAQKMIEDFAHFYPPLLRHFEIAELKFSIRAMPRSGADTRLVDVQWGASNVINVRAGKIDAILHAERAIREMAGL